MADFTLLALKNEIDNDPEAIGYKEVDGITWKGDQVIADLINNASGANPYTIDISALPLTTLCANIKVEWHGSLLADQKGWLDFVAVCGDEVLINADTKLNLTGRTLATNGTAGTGSGASSFWGGNAAARDAAADAMLPLIEVTGSRAEVLWGSGTTITASQVGQAFNQ